MAQQAPDDEPSRPSRRLTGARLKRRRVPAAARVIASLLVLVAIGTALLWISGAGTAQPLTLQESLFTAVSALAVTGLSTISPGTDLTFFGQVVLMALIQVGGIGFMVLAVGVLRALRRQVSLFAREAMRDSLGLSETIEFRTVLRRVLVSMLVLESVGAVLLWLHWRSTLGDATAAFYGLFHAVSAFCNAGFSLFNPAQYPAGIPRDTISLAILGGLIVCGGLGFPVLADVMEWPERKRLSLHTRLTISVAAILIAAGAIGLLLAENRTASGALHGVPWHEQIVLSVFQSISARTAGFSVMANMQQLTAASQVLLIGLMFIGTAPASMGGGITTGTLVVLALAMWSYARRMRSVQVSKRRIPADAVRRASAVLLVALLVVAVATWLILLEQPAPLDSVVFEVVSAFSTTGLSLSYTAQLSSFGQGVIMLCMLWGRLGTLTVIAALGGYVPPERVEYPEERLLLG
jgi:trk system potassium uptake protein TrkH